MDMKKVVTNEQPDWLDDIETTLNRFPILLRSNEWTKGTNFHHQPGLEIHLTQEGGGTMVVGRQVLLQSPRSVAVYWGSVPHQMIAKSAYRRTVICLDPDESAAGPLPPLYRLVDFSWVPRDSCLSFQLAPKQFQRLEEICAALRRELDAREIGWERMALSHVLQATVLLQRSLEEAAGQAAAANSQPAGKKSELVQQCSDYVCGRLGEDLALKTVAKRFAVSDEYLTRSFTREMGISFYQYVLLQRVAEGRRLLREAPDLSISAIAYLIGFPSSSHFSRHFRALTGETPSSYRQRASGPE